MRRDHARTPPVTTGLRRPHVATPLPGAAGGSGASRVPDDPADTSPVLDPLPADDLGRRRAVIENVRPSVDGGRFPIKRVVGDRSRPRGRIRGWPRRRRGAAAPPPRGRGSLDRGRDGRSRQRPLVGRRSTSIGRPPPLHGRGLGRSLRVVERDLRKRIDAGQDVTVDLLIGADLVDAAATRADTAGAADGRGAAARMGGRPARARRQPPGRAAIRLDDAAIAAAAAASRSQPRDDASSPSLEVVVDPRARRLLRLVRALPALDLARSAAPRHVRATSSRACRYVAGPGLRRALPAADPSRSAGTFRKGPNNVVDAAARRSRACPWAIGAAEGGHTAVHPELGTLADFDALVDGRARARHRDRARHRLPGVARSSVGHASTRRGSARDPTARSSTPRTRPRNTRTSTRSTSRRADWRALWQALRDVFRFWIDAGRHDLPRRQPAHEGRSRSGSGASATIKRDHPEVLFLAEAFTRPKVDVPARQARLQPVLHVLHVAQHRSRS